MNNYLTSNLSGEITVVSSTIEVGGLHARVNQRDVGVGLLVEYDRELIFGEAGNPKLDVRFTSHSTSPKRPNNVFFSGDWMINRTISIPQGPIESMVHVVGEGNHERFVYVFDIPKEINLRAGLTVHSGYGTWSSWPMHTFEKNALHSPAKLYQDFREVFVFVTDTPGGWGLQTIVEKNSITNRAVGDGEVVNVPLSFHPVVAAPDTRMAYFWAYTNGGEKFTKEGRV